MSIDPWTADDPQPGAFDADLASIDRELIDTHEGHSDAMLRILVSVEGDDALRLGRIAEAQGKTPQNVVAALLRDADGSAA